MNRVLLDLGFIQIYWYSLFVFLALFVGGALAIREAKRFKISEEKMINMFFFLIPISLIGARLYYVIFNWSYYSNNLIEIFEIWQGGLAIHGGLIAGILFVIFYCMKYKISIGRMTDILVVSLIIGQAIGRWGNFFNAEAHGGATTLEFLNSIIPFNFIVEGMNINGTYYHPTFLYESLWCIIGFIGLLVIRRFKYIQIGQITAVYLIWYGIGRFFIEGMRTDSLMLGNIKMAQVASVFMIILGIFILLLKARKFKLDDRYNISEEE